MEKLPGEVNPQLVLALSFPHQKPKCKQPRRSSMKQNEHLKEHNSFGSTMMSLEIIGLF